jgi:hypothetical protein
MSNYDALVKHLLETHKDEKESSEEVEIDTKKADLNHDGKLSEYEKKRAEAIEKAIEDKKK